MRRLIGMTSAFALVAAVAVAQDVGYNYDQSADFSKYKSYKWVKVQGAEAMNDLVDQQIRGAIDKQLALKGMTAVSGDGAADLLLAYQVALNQEKQLTTWDTGYGMGPGWGGRWYGGYYGGGMSTSTTSTIQIGTLALDMYDAGSKKLVWRGMASKQIDTKASPEKRQKNLDKGVKKLLEKNYPPKPKT